MTDIKINTDAIQNIENNNTLPKSNFKGMLEEINNAEPQKTSSMAMQQTVFKTDKKENETINQIVKQNEENKKKDNSQNEKQNLMDEKKDDTLIKQKKSREEILQTNKDKIIQMLRLLNDYKYASLETLNSFLNQLHNDNEPICTTETRLRRMTYDDKTLKRWNRNGVYFFTPTKKGIELIDGDLKHWTHTQPPQTWKHSVITTDIAIEYGQKYEIFNDKQIKQSPEGHILSKCKIIPSAIIAMSNQKYNTRTGELKKTEYKIPDLVAFTDDKKVFIEVEITNKRNLGDIAEKVNTYGKAKQLTYWFFANEKDRRYYEKIIEKNGQQNTQKTFILDDKYNAILKAN
jgi:hypothetical protein